MPRNSTYNPNIIYDSNIRGRRTLKIDTFRGVDYATSPLNLPSDTATDILNLMYDRESGRIITRNGFRTSTVDSFDGTIRGLWTLNGTRFALIGTEMLYYGNSIWNTVSNWEKDWVNDELDAINGFINNGKLYVLCGYKFAVVSIENGTPTANAVEDVAYVPTTSHLISCDEMPVDKAIYAMDDSNLLSKRRTNGFQMPTREWLRKVLNEETDMSQFIDEYLHWNGDAPIAEDKIEDTEITIETVNGNIDVIVDGSFVLEEDNTTYHMMKHNNETIGYIVLNDTSFQIRIEWSVILANKYYSSYSNNSAMSVTFTTGDDSELEDRINHCTIGKVFHNRLFVSGNPDYPNTDWHTSDNNGDYTYFSDLDYCNYGSSDTAIMGYDTFNNGDLIVFKESSTNEPTIYKRKYELIQARDYTGTTISGQYEEGFPMESLNSGGISALNFRSVCDFNGTTVILTSDGLKAYVSDSESFDNARYLHDVSSAINPKLRESDLSKAFIYSYGDRLYLSVGDMTYVAEYGLTGANGEFSWFVWKDMEALSFTVDNGTVKFIKAINGKSHLVEMTENPMDEMSVSLTMGTVYGDNTKNYITLSNNAVDYIMNGNCDVELSESIMVNVGKATCNSNGTVTVSSSQAPMVSGATLMVNGNKVTAKPCGKTGWDFELIRENGARLTYATGTEITITAYISSLNKAKLRHVSGNDYEIMINGIKADLYPDNTHSITGSVTLRKAIKSHFTTPPMSMGSIAYLKNIYSWVIVNDTKYNSAMDVGYMVSNAQGGYESIFGNTGAIKADNYSNFNYDRFKYVNENLPRIYARTKILQRVPSIMFSFVSVDGIKMVLGSMSIVYTNGSLVKGVR